MLQPQATVPIDRLRYQAKLVFDTFDDDADGRLTAEQLQAYFRYSDERLGTHTPLTQRYEAAAAAAQARSGGALGFEDFVQLVRDQLRLVDKNSSWAQTQLNPRELNTLLQKSALTMSELGVVLATFRLLDTANSGKLPLSFLRKAQGIEAKVVEGVLEDADEDEDGALSFAEFLTSYHRERPVFMTMAVLLAHTACFYVIFNLAIDTTLKVILAGLLVVKPFLVTGPVVKLYRIAEALWSRFVATRELAGRGVSVSALY